MRRFSTVLLALEAALLIYPSLLGMLFALTLISIGPASSFGVLRILEEVGTAVCVMILLFAGWRLLLVRVVGGVTRIRATHWGWWGLAGFGAIASVVSLAIGELSNGEYSAALRAQPFFGLMPYGVLFVPTFLHLSIDAALGREF